MPSLSAHATREPSGENVGLAELYVSAASSGISHGTRGREQPQHDAARRAAGLGGVVGEHRDPAADA